MTVSDVGDVSLVEFVEGEVGSALRGIVRYRDEGSAWLSLRPDLANGDRTDLALHALAERLRDRERTAAETTLHVPEDAVIVRFPHDEGGTLVSLDPHTAVEPGFVRACEAIVEAGAPQQSERVVEP
ncbi:hypothetical protein [Haloplanus halophilus]|uniref:hypothetical protein n=1 Tax=Haloplanus halophilus TaxID=2949993 RepID=UPI00203FCC1C|nr:hypothetical protein [Haloplanus sp. GDY1]